MSKHVLSNYLIQYAPVYPGLEWIYSCWAPPCSDLVLKNIGFGQGILTKSRKPDQCWNGTINEWNILWTGESPNWWTPLRFLCLKTLSNWARLKSWMTSLPFDLIFDNSWHIFSFFFCKKKNQKPPKNYIKSPSCGGTKQPISRSMIRPGAPHLPRS